LIITASVSTSGFSRRPVNINTQTNGNLLPTQMILRYSLVVLGFSPLLTASHLARPIANTSSGSYVGFYDAQNQVDRFLGLRFASPPTQRFTPTIPVSSATKGLQNATTFGADCPQLPAPLSVAGFAAGPPLRGANQSEDCFFVNASLFHA
jgi:hypothetical protein